MTREASVQHAAHHRGRVCGPQFKPGAKPGLIIVGSVARELDAQVPPVGSLILAIGWTRPAIWTARVLRGDLGHQIRNFAKEITGACVEIGPAVRGIDVGTRPTR